MSQMYIELLLQKVKTYERLSLPTDYMPIVYGIPAGD